MGGANLPYAISQDGNYTLYNGASSLHSAAGKNPIYDSNGQIITNNGVDASNLYIYYKYGNNPYIPSPDSVWAFGLPEAVRHNLWGNGRMIEETTEDLPGAILSHFYIVAKTTKAL